MGSDVIAIGSDEKETYSSIPPSNRLRGSFITPSYNRLAYHRYTATYSNDIRLHHYRFLVTRYSHKARKHLALIISSQV